MGLRIIIDLFVNLDEFTEKSGTWPVLKGMLIYYGLNSALYFRDFAGMITVVAASFSFGRMVRSSELVAVMASGVSLKRLISPIIVLAIFLTGLLVIDQEIIIPPLAPKLVRDRDAERGKEYYDVWFMTDGNGSLICSQRFDVETSTFHFPTIIMRRQKPPPNEWEWEITGLIRADAAVYNRKNELWDLANGVLIERDSIKGPQQIAAYDTGDLTPLEVPVRRTAQFKTLLSSGQLARLAEQETKIKDVAQLWSQKHFRITDPLMPRPQGDEIRRYDQLRRYRGLFRDDFRMQAARHRSHFRQRHAGTMGMAADFHLLAGSLHRIRLHEDVNCPEDSTVSPRQLSKMCCVKIHFAGVIPTPARSGGIY
jgi:lipopolysaccharide export LptBFGC system permease protein LptF